MISIDWLYTLPLTRNEQYLAHLMVGLMIQLIFCRRLKIGLILVALAGIGKELLDWNKHGQFDWLDIGYTILGAIIILIIRRPKK